MKLFRILIYLPGIVALLLGTAAYMEYVYFAGFPDGYMSELVRAEKILFTFFFTSSVVFGFLCLLHAWLAFTKNNGIYKEKNIKHLYYHSIAYIIILVIVGLIEYYLIIHCSGSVGAST
jgi:hypothetical protein